MVIEEQLTPKSAYRTEDWRPEPPANGAVCATKMNLNKPTQFDKAIKELIAPEVISKAIHNPSKPNRKAIESQKTYARPISAA